MAGKRRMVQHNLVKNAIAAYFAAIEIHNKPHIDYRYQVVSLLMVNAWELILKAFVKKYDKNHSIYIKNEAHKTVTFEKVVDYTEQYINTLQPKHFTATQENLYLLNNYRNCFAHYYSGEIEPFIFMVIAKSAINFVQFVKEYFGKDIGADEGLYILPIGFKLPFRVEDFLSRRSADYPEHPEVIDFIHSIINTTSMLSENGIEESVVVGFDLLLQQVKQETNQTILATITKNDENAVAFRKKTQVVLSSDPNAQSVKVDEETLFSLYPLSYNDVCRKCREEITGFKQNSEFNRIMSDLKQNPQYTKIRALRPHNPKTPKTGCYAENIIEEIRKQYQK